MEASFTANASRNEARPRCTEKLSLGRRFERHADAYCRALGWRLVAKNLRLKGGEIDLLYDDGRALILVEVRGKSDPGVPPSRSIAGSKIARLHRLAARVSAVHRRTVRVELCEVLGAGPRPQIRLFRVD